VGSCLPNAPPDHDHSLPFPQARIEGIAEGIAEIGEAPDDEEDGPPGPTASEGPELQQLCIIAWYSACMPKTVQIRDIDDATYAGLQRHAAAAGTSVPELLRREATRLAARPTTEEWLARTRRRTSGGSNADTIAALDEIRGPWPNGDC
jgi:antitoxin FitA